MADELHIQWLLEGVESWNHRREQQQPGFRPNFAGVNLYREFDQAGQLDDTGSVPLDGVNLQFADLRRTIFQEPSQEEVTSIAMFGTNLRGANLNQADLRGAELTRARLDEADLREANLAYATLDECVLWGSNLTRANLTRATLTHAVLSGAYLTGAVLEGASLWGAELDGVYFSGSQPWEANYHSSPGLESALRLPSGGSKVTTISTVEELLAAVRQLKSAYESELSKWPAAEGVPALNWPRFYFRGHADAGWVLCPYAMRHERTRGSEGAMLNELVLRRPEDFSPNGSAFSWWVLAQHHGLPTRFLDLSRNPLVALFHACEAPEQRERDGLLHVFAVTPNLIERFDGDRASIIANFARLDRSKQVALLGARDENSLGSHVGSYRPAMQELCELIGRENPRFGDYVDIRELLGVFVIEPQHSLERLRAQSGAFLASAFHERFEPTEVLTRAGSGPGLGIGQGVPIYSHYEMLVPADAKRSLLVDLEMLDITREKLFPGLDSAAQFVRLGAIERGGGP